MGCTMCVCVRRVSALGHTHARVCTQAPLACHAVIRAGIFLSALQNLAARALGARPRRALHGSEATPCLASLAFTPVMPFPLPQRAMSVEQFGEMLWAMGGMLAQQQALFAQQYAQSQ